MMENISHILQCLLIATDAYSSNNLFGSTFPFKVHVNFYIPVFESQIDADALHKWLNMIEGYFSVHDFSSQENITFALLKATPRVKDWWETYCEQKGKRESSLFLVALNWNSFRDAIKEEYYPVGSYEAKCIKCTTL